LANLAGRFRAKGQFLSTAGSVRCYEASKTRPMIFNSLAETSTAQGQKLPVASYVKMGKTFLFSEDPEYSSKRQTFSSSGS